MADPSPSTLAQTVPHNKTTRKPRTLVLCFDGTSDEYGSKVRDFRPFPSGDTAIVPTKCHLEHKCGQVVFAFE
jgi:hypothetical protein